MDVNGEEIFMIHKMNKIVSRTENLREQTEKSSEQIKHWTWSELLVALKQCQEDPLPLVTLVKLFDSLIERVAPFHEANSCPSTSSPDSSGFRFSCDTRSSECLNNDSFFRATWWFEDVVALDLHVVKMLVKSMVSRNFDNEIISKFLFYYRKSKFASAVPDMKMKIVDAVVEMLCSLDIRCVSYKRLFEMLRVAMNLNVSRCFTNKLASMIGSLLDQATVDNLLVPSPHRRSYMYDVNLVLGFVKSFLDKGVCCVPLSRVKKVATLMDLYLTEIAPDPYLKPSKFLAVIRALPESARDSFDVVYHAVNMYLQVHSGLSEEQKMKVCSGLNYEKLSTEAFMHLTQNANFPSKSAVEALISQQCRLKRLLHNTDKGGTTGYDPPSALQTACVGSKGEGSQQIVLYVQKLNGSDESEKLKSHLQGMQWRVVELEKVCQKMQIQMAKVIKSRLSNNRSSVPKLCS